MAADIVLISRFPLVPQASKLIASTLKDDANTRYLFDLEQQELLQLRSYDGIADFAAKVGELSADLQRFASHMTADVKRELLAYVEAPKQGARAQDCYAYGDDISDLAMLEAVGMAVAVGATTDLTTLAGARGWGHLRV